MEFGLNNTRMARSDVWGTRHPLRLLQNYALNIHRKPAFVDKKDGDVVER